MPVERKGKPSQAKSFMKSEKKNYRCVVYVFSLRSTNPRFPGLKRLLPELFGLLPFMKERYSWFCLVRPPEMSYLLTHGGEGSPGYGDFLSRRKVDVAAQTCQTRQLRKSTACHMAYKEAYAIYERS